MLVSFLKSIKFYLLIAVFILLSGVWLGLRRVNNDMLYSGQNDGEELSRETILNADYKSYNEIKAEELASSSGLSRLFSSGERERKIQFIDTDWRDLAKYNTATGQFPDKYAYLRNANIRIAGYITPLQSDSPDKIREFLFSPYAGACIHVPPPPVNQAIYVKLDTAADFIGLWQPVYLYGNLKTEASSVTSEDLSYSADAGFIIHNAVVIPLEE